MAKLRNTRHYKPAGYSAEKKGYQPSQNPPSKNPPQGGSGIAPAPPPHSRSQTGTTTHTSSEPKKTK